MWSEQQVAASPDGPTTAVRAHVTPQRRAVLGAAAGVALSLLATTPARAASLCESGRRQSPIDVPVLHPEPGPALRWDFHPAPLRADHDGHTVRVRFAPGQRLWLGTEALTLQQFHFHHPGGDRLQGEDFPLGMHFLHRGASGRLVSLVVLLREGAEHPALAALLPHLPGPGRPGVQDGSVQVDPAQWLPASHAYFRYDGSLTAPPCTEGVLWLVLQQPLSASPAQLAALGRLFGPNARPVQPLNGRRVSLHP